MANYSTLKAAVAAVVKSNGNQEVTGANMQTTLLSIINSIGGGGYIFEGIATPNTSPGTPDENVFYIGGAGTYNNFGTSVTVPVGSICVFKYNGSWAKEQIALFAGIDDAPTENSDNLVKSGGIFSSIIQFGSYISNPEYIRAYTDANGIFLWGIKRDGSIEWGKGVPTPVAEYIEELFNDEDIDEIKTLLDYLSVIQDREERIEMTLDSDNHILAYRTKDGTKVEEKFKANHIALSDEATQELADALNRIGWMNASPIDWSDKEFVELPIPSTCAVVNIGVNSQAETKSSDINTFLQYWDMNGNYFKKDIVLNAQGNSSLGYHIKNQSIDLDDGSQIRFGDWVPCDSFHLKKYFIDVFRGQCVVGYRLAEQFYRSRPYGERRPWDYLFASSSVSDGRGEFKEDFPTGAMAHPDGFPIHIFFNGNDAGVYTWNLKKDRANYMCKKNKQNNIILDGAIGSVFFTANGDMSVHEFDTSNSLWEDFEIRNPKIATDINGNPYDGDNPKEPSNDYATTKAAIVRLTTSLTAVDEILTTDGKKAKFEQYFNVPMMIDYDIFANVVYHYDGYWKNWIWVSLDGSIWSPTIYDVDSIFGQHWNGASYVTASTTQILGNTNGLPTRVLKQLYTTEMRARYKQLREAGIISVDNIVGILEKWLLTMGYDNLKNDIENICTSPYSVGGNIVVDGGGNPVLIPNTPSYRDGSKTYIYKPTTGGWYNSVERVKNWLEARIATLDTYFNY